MVLVRVQDKRKTMKELAKPVTVVEVENEGFAAFLGKKITLWCVDYIRTGRLVGINDKFIKLDEAAIVYETGELGAKAFKDAQETGKEMYVMVQAITAFEAGK